jgi:chromosomal replication initiator protein
VSLQVIAASAATSTAAQRAPAAPHASPARSAQAPPPLPPMADFNPKYTFDQYVIGDANRLAHAAALAVAELPGHAYNPLFIYGPPGLGKTHLLHSIANYIDAHGDGLVVRYATTEEFTNSFVHALQTRNVEAFKQRFRGADVVLIDDIQFLASKARTEEEFFHTFNALYEAGSQLVLTSDRPPRDLQGLEDRLRERFECGLVTDVRPPDRATRLTILRKRAHHDQVPLAEPEALEPLAERITANIRLLEGALIRLVAYHSLTGRPIDRALVNEVLDRLYPEHPTNEVTVPRIQAVVCENFDVSHDELMSRGRGADLAWARHVGMYLARELTQESLPAIGRQFGGRNHTTVLHACRRTAERMAHDREAFDAINNLASELAGDTPPDRLD